MNHFQSREAATAAMIPPAQKPPQILEAINLHENMLGELDSAISALLSRLGPVLRPEGPRPASQDVDVRHADTEVGKRLSASTNKIMSLTDAVRDHLSRLEI